MPDEMRVRVKRHGRDHLVRLTGDGDPTYWTRCGMQIPVRGDVGPRGGILCVQCRRKQKEEEGDAPARVHILRPLRDSRSDIALRAEKKREKKEKTRVLYREALAGLTQRAA